MIREDENMKAVCFGEVLWDISEKSQTLGGAPLNVLGHVARLGDQGIIISAVGSDDLGARTAESLASLGIDTRYLAVKDGVKTGKAFIRLEDGIPSYSFNSPAAWDLIDVPGESFFSSSYDVFIFGTLSQRNEKSRKTLYHILDSIKCKEIFFDVNLRLFFYSDEIIRESLSRCTILKMNDEELPVVLKATGRDDVFSLMEKYDIRITLVTNGKKGTDCYTCERVYHQDAMKVQVVDTVGAGDSLSGAFLHFLLLGDTVEDALRKAGTVADYVVTKPGAIPEYDDEIMRKIICVPGGYSHSGSMCHT